MNRTNTLPQDSAAYKLSLQLDQLATDLHARLLDLDIDNDHVQLIHEGLFFVQCRLIESPLDSLEALDGLLSRSMGQVILINYLLPMTTDPQHDRALPPYLKLGEWLGQQLYRFSLKVPRAKSHDQPTKESTR